MKLFCPQCDHTVHFSSHQTERRCPACGFVINLTQLNTGEHRAQILLEQDFSGDTVDGYRLEEVLGHGGMGTVYRVVGDDGSQLAMKVLNQLFAGNENFIKRFQRESEILGRLSHPNIVRLHGSGEYEGRFYYLMDYVDGLPLNRFFKATAARLPRKFDLATQICRALAYAHQQGVVHRDIKPSNILVSRENDAVKLVDFGIAQHGGPEEHKTQLTTTNAVLGTFNYMSPEQRLSAARVDERADVYSFGVVLYELFTGRLPMGAFPAPSQLDSTLPAGLDDVISRCLHPDPEKRYSGMLSVLADLKNASDDPVPDTRTMPAGKSRSGRPMLALVAALIVLVGGSIGLYSFDIIGTRPTSDNEVKQRQPPLKQVETGQLNDNEDLQRRMGSRKPGKNLKILPKTVPNQLNPPLTTKNNAPLTKDGPNKWRVNKRVVTVKATVKKKRRRKKRRRVRSKKMSGVKKPLNNRKVPRRKRGSKRKKSKLSQTTSSKRKPGLKLRKGQPDRQQLNKRKPGSKLRKSDLQQKKPNKRKPGSILRKSQIDQKKPNKRKPGTAWPLPKPESQIPVQQKQSPKTKQKRKRSPSKNSF